MSYLLKIYNVSFTVLSQRFSNTEKG